MVHNHVAWLTIYCTDYFAPQTNSYDNATFKKYTRLYYLINAHIGYRYLRTVLPDENVLFFILILGPTLRLVVSVRHTIS